MSALSPFFLWLIPLAFLPVIIHLLNRLRYQTVKWAAMMFLRSADRDASRRAKVRQWIILAARCLMLLMFLLALSRLQSKGRLARFFDSGSNLVVILFDRSASMEQLRGGVSGRERAISLLNQGLSELGPGARVIWMDSVTGELTPLPNGIELDRLPFVTSSETTSDLSAMLRSALQEIARAGVTQAEVWIPTDRQSSAWLPVGANPPDWSEWTGMNTQITLRLLDVAQVPADLGNRSLQLMGPPVWDGEQLSLQLRLMRDTASPESVPIQIDFGGLSLREELLVEGRSFVWEQTLPVEEGQKRVNALLGLPADSNPADNRVAVSWVNHGAAKAVVNTGDLRVDAVTRAGLLPRVGLREIVSEGVTPDDEILFKVIQGFADLSATDQTWVEEGGVLFQLPLLRSLVPVGKDDEGLSVDRWVEESGVLSTEQREPLRLDLVRVFQAADLPVDSDVDQILASLEDGAPLLIKKPLGQGAIYQLSTLPLAQASNLDAGYIWVPLLQRMLLEGGVQSYRFGTYVLGEKEWDSSEWTAIDGAENSVLLNVGRFRTDGGIMALNRSASEDGLEQLSVGELTEWAQPLDLRVFEDRSEVENDINSRFEFTALLALLGLLFLVVESWLLTRNIRRSAKPNSGWGATA